jgi:hypothetical protein
MTVEEKFKLFFPSNDISPDAYSIVKAFNIKDYKFTR